LRGCKAILTLSKIALIKLKKLQAKELMEKCQDAEVVQPHNSSIEWNNG
jgi:hypothetical protein